MSTAFLTLLQQRLAPALEGTAVSAEPPAVTARGVSHGVLVLEVQRAAVPALVTRLREEFAFDLFLDVTAVDWPDRAARFEVVHHFYSTTHKVRVRLTQHVTEEDPEVESLVRFYGSAAYMERECHDMYGIRFRGNDDLRPILLYEGFVGHPLRKDYPKQREQPLVPYRPPQSALVR